ncbi:MAG TPA: TIGR02996 domain-containing protein [Kofleriaceae bacterium]
MTTRNELEALLEAAPLDDAGYLIFGDWLQAAGDPRGELIALDHGASRAPPHERPRWAQRRRELIARHPELAPPEHEDITYRWHLGFVRTLVVRARSVLQLAAVLHHPALRFTSAIELDAYRSLQDQALAEIVANAPRSLRSLTIARESYLWREDEVLELDATLAAIPQLEHLSAATPIRLTQPVSLRSLELFGIGSAVFDWLPAVQLAQLASLALHAGTRNPEIRWSELKKLVDAPLPALVSLAVHHASRGDEIVAGLAQAPLLRRLRVLKLWNAGLTAAGARHITPEAFGHLALLDLSDAGLDREVARELSRVCGEVRTIPELITSSLRRPPSSAPT